MSIINQTEEVTLLKNNENSKSFIDDQVNLDCRVNVLRMFSLTW